MDTCRECRERDATRSGLCDACYRRALRASKRGPDPVCGYCGKTFTPQRYHQSDRARYCSREHKEMVRRSDGRAAESSLKHYYASRYGLTLEQAEQLREAGCAICGSTGEDGRWGNLHIDHDHGTGRVRGVLCTNHNTGLGKFDDDPVLLRRAADYLERGSGC